MLLKKSGMRFVAIVRWRWASARTRQSSASSTRCSCARCLTRPGQTGAAFGRQSASAADVHLVPEFPRLARAEHSLFGDRRDAVSQPQPDGRGRARTLSGRAVSAEFFDVLGVKPALGRSFLAEEDRPGANRVGDHQSRLVAAPLRVGPAILGKQLTLSGDELHGHRRAARRVIASARRPMCSCRSACAPPR